MVTHVDGCRNLRIHGGQRFDGLNFSPALCQRKLGVRSKLMVTLNWHTCGGDQGGVPILRGKLLEPLTGMHTISVMRLRR